MMSRFGKLAAVLSTCSTLAHGAVWDELALTGDEATLEKHSKYEKTLGLAPDAFGLRFGYVTFKDEWQLNEAALTTLFTQWYWNGRKMPLLEVFGSYAPSNFSDTIGGSGDYWSFGTVFYPLTTTFYEDQLVLALGTGVAYSGISSRIADSAGASLLVRGEALWALSGHVSAGGYLDFAYFTGSLQGSQGWAQSGGVMLKIVR